MPVDKTPAADLRRRYPLYAEAGLALALGATVLAFTIPSPPSKAAPLAAPAEVAVELIDVPVTDHAPPPPPPPAAPPPPQEVPDHVEVDEVVEAIELSLGDAVIPPAPPVSPPAPVVEPTPEVAPPPPPPAPPVVETTEPEIFDVAEVQPELIGGLGALQAAVEYPEFARRAGVEGTVTIQFVVDERGNVVDPVVVRSPNDLLSEAALDAVRKVKFTPGQQRGRPVKVRFAAPVTFRLR